MNIELRYFASVRETLGIANETADVPDEVVNVGNVRAWLRPRAAHGLQSCDDGCVAAHHGRLRSGVFSAGHGRLT